MTNVSETNSNFEMNDFRNLQVTSLAIHIRFPSIILARVHIVLIGMSAL